MREYNQPLLVADTPLLVHERAELLARLCAIEPEPGVPVGIHRVGVDRAREYSRFGSDHGDELLEVARRCL